MVSLTIVRNVFNNLKRSGMSDASANANVSTMYEARTPVLTGIDANDNQGFPSQIMHGESLHLKLKLLVIPRLVSLDAMKAATSLPVK
jgi:hypothetical protein